MAEKEEMARKYDEYVNAVKETFATVSAESGSKMVAKDSTKAITILSNA